MSLSLQAFPHGIRMFNQLQASRTIPQALKLVSSSIAVAIRAPAQSLQISSQGASQVYFGYNPTAEALGLCWGQGGGEGAL